MHPCTHLPSPVLLETSELVSGTGKHPEKKTAGGLPAALGWAPTRDARDPRPTLEGKAGRDPITDQAPLGLHNGGAEAREVITCPDTCSQLAKSQAEFTAISATHHHSGPNNCTEKMPPQNLWFYSEIGYHALSGRQETAWFQ